MKARTITIEYAATRSQDFQSVRLGASIEVELDEGETPIQVIAKVRPSLMRAVNGQVHRAIDDLLFGPAPEPETTELTRAA